MTNINLYESVWEEITYSGWVELKRDGLNIKLDNEPSRYYKKIENKCSCGCHKQEGYEEGCDLCSESHDEKIDNLYTKQNGSHDLHPTSGYDSRWQTIIGNSGDTDKNTDKSQGFSNNKPMVSLDFFDSKEKCDNCKHKHNIYNTDLPCYVCGCIHFKHSNSEGEIISGSKTPSTKPAPSEIFVLSDKIEICDEHEERELIPVSDVKEAVKLLKEISRKQGFIKYILERDLDKIMGDKLCQ